MGSGTTGVVCEQSQRVFYGIELNKEYVEIAKKRINEKKEPQRTISKKVAKTFKPINPGLKVIDIFAGVGGLTHGFKLAGFDTVAAVEFDPKIAEGFKLNNGRCRLGN